MKLNFAARFALLLFTIACLITGQSARGQFSKATVLLTGSVTDAETHQPVRARLSFMEGGVEKNKVMSTSEGKYTAVLKPGIAYSVKIVASQKYQCTESVSFPTGESSQQSSRDFTVRPIHERTIMVDGNGCFLCGSVSPMQTYALEAATAGKIMAGNDEIEVTIETFSDDRVEGVPLPADQGTQRAEALKSILIANGAPKNRIILNPHNPPPPPAVKEEPVTKGKKKAKAIKKPKVAKKPVKGKKGAEAAPCWSKAQIKITKLHSEDE